MTVSGDDGSAVVPAAVVTISIRDNNGGTTTSIPRCTIHSNGKMLVGFLID
jgi:hypothetical protein